VDEDSGFPLSPNDRRFLLRLERSRRYVPPPSAPECEAKELPPRSPASRAAERILLRYINRARASVPGPCANRTCLRGSGLASPLVRLAWEAAATALLPLEVVCLLVFRPGLRGTALRAALLRPQDLERVLCGRGRGSRP